VRESAAVASARYAVPTVVATTIGAKVAALVPWTDESGLVVTVCLDKVGAAPSAAVGVGNEPDTVGPVGTATLCVGDDSGEAGPGFAVCVSNDAGTVLAVGDEANGSALGTLLALKEGKAVGKRLGPAVRNVDGSSDGPELEGDMERSAGLEDGPELGPKVGKGDDALVG
jgi:hypothetical protein